MKKSEHADAGDRRPETASDGTVYQKNNIKSKNLNGSYRNIVNRPTIYGMTVVPAEDQNNA